MSLFLLDWTHSFPFWFVIHVNVSRSVSLSACLSVCLYLFALFLFVFFFSVIVIKSHIIRLHHCPYVYFPSSVNSNGFFFSFHTPAITDFFLILQIIISLRVFKILFYSPAILSTQSVSLSVSLSLSCVCLLHCLSVRSFAFLYIFVIAYTWLVHKSGIPQKEPIGEIDEFTHLSAE